MNLAVTVRLKKKVSVSIALKRKISVSVVLKNTEINNIPPTVIGYAGETFVT